LTFQKNNNGYENTVPIPQFHKTTEPCLPPVNAAENNSSHSDESRTFLEIGTATRQNISTVQSKDHQQKRMINQSTEIWSRQSKADNADKNESVEFENGKAPADKLQNAFAFINTEIHSPNIICDDRANVNDEAHSDKSVSYQKVLQNNDDDDDEDNDDSDSVGLQNDERKTDEDSVDEMVADKENIEAVARVLARHLPYPGK